MAAAFQTMFAKLSPSQQGEVEADIKRAVQTCEVRGKVALP
jgi:hypothetical protein